MPDLTGPFVFHFAFFAAGIALFVATPGVPRRKAVTGALLIAAPIILLAHGAEHAVSVIPQTPHIDGFTHVSSTALGYASVGVNGLADALEAALPIVLWLTWRSRTGRPSPANRLPESTTHFELWRQASSRTASGDMRRTPKRESPKTKDRDDTARCETYS